MGNRNNSKPDNLEYVSIAEVPIEDFIAIMDVLVKVEGEVKYSKIKKGRKSHWYNLIMNGNLKCPVSGIEAKLCRFDVLKFKNKPSSYHFNFYGENGEFLTIDHKIPLSKGGKDFYENVQPMLAEINWKKGNELIHT